MFDFITKLSRKTSDEGPAMAAAASRDGAGGELSPPSEPPNAHSSLLSELSADHKLFMDPLFFDDPSVSESCAKHGVPNRLALDPGSPCGFLPGDSCGVSEERLSCAIFQRANFSFDAAFVETPLQCVSEMGVFESGCFDELPLEECALDEKWGDDLNFNRPDLTDIAALETTDSSGPLNALVLGNEETDLDYFFRGQNVLHQEQERQGEVLDFESFFEDVPRLLSEEPDLPNHRHQTKLKGENQWADPDGPEAPRLTISEHTTRMEEDLIIDPQTDTSKATLANSPNLSSELGTENYGLGCPIPMPGRDRASASTKEAPSESPLCKMIQSVLKKIEEKRTPVSSIAEYASSSHSKEDWDRIPSSDESLEALPAQKHPPLSFKNGSPPQGSQPSRKRSRSGLTSPETREEPNGSSPSEKGSMDEMPPEDQLDKNEKRRVRNREAALHSRQRKKSYLLELQNKCSYYESQIKSLRHLVSVTSMENNFLRGELLRYHPPTDRATPPSSECTAKDVKLSACNPSFPFVASVFTTANENRVNVDETLSNPFQNMESCADEAESAVLESDSLPMESLLPPIARPRHVLAFVHLFFILHFLCPFSSPEQRSALSNQNANTFVRKAEHKFMDDSSPFGFCSLFKLLFHAALRLWSNGAWFFRHKNRIDDSLAFLSTLTFEPGLHSSQIPLGCLKLLQSYLCTFSI